MRVNAITPGVIDTEWMVRSAGEQAFQRTKDRVAKVATLGGISSADDIAAAVVWLLHARAMTGELIRIDAGFTLGR
ncbi:SDR family oxidoreductase [Sphingobium chungbukense]|uniref:Short-chain dehydrogenase n=1 Tax=Sphingobium chungbukense TaxID=56193 RepID=A0A0M3AZF1_9SPHN|nr:SDR family oxidoreductase [Sphingobium chungbukense]KKW93934.1 hypothetical protein YP76_04645 [Sphingobium chungbukense]